MTEQEITKQIRQMKEFGAKISLSKKLAIDTLKTAGIMNSKGEVRGQFKKALGVETPLEYQIYGEDAP